MVKFVDVIEQASNNTYRSENWFSEWLTYDLRGNIKTFNRRAPIWNVNCYNQSIIDNLTYIYDLSNTGNKVQTITDGSGLNQGISNGTGSYGYTSYGALTTDTRKGITDIKYNHLQLPYEINFSNGNYIRWIYDAEGNKLRKITKTGTAAATTTDYASGIEYRGTALDAIYHSEGRVKYTGTTPRYEYTLSDHLGNGRVYYNDLNNNGAGDITDIIQDNHYYPFGLNHTDPRRNAGNPVNLYQYNGKELVEDNGLGWSHYGARAYDAAVGRWWVVDPQIEKSHRESGFLYAGNTPITYIDFNGRFKLPAEFIRDYPMFAKYLQENISEILLSETIMQGLETHSNGALTRDRVAKDIKFGEGPAITIRNLNNIASADGSIQGKKFGHYDGVVNGDPTIALDVSVMKKFEDFMKRSDVSDAVKEALLLGIVSTLLHEYVHVGTGGKTFEDGEHGINFENAVYGRNIEPDNGTSTLGVRTLKKYGEWYNENAKKGTKDEDSERQKNPSVLPTLPKN